jgi:hydrogenase maturation protein HypF
VTNLNIKKPDIKGAELLVQGVVQGVGFRPFVYNLANRLHISGTVTNTSVGVFIKASASDTNLTSFIHQLKDQAPPLARITSIDVRPLTDPISEKEFFIVESEDTGVSSAIIPPDIALCTDCISELLTPKDRRHHYPFINCTNCGPRFSIVEKIPYDRPKTSMKHFPMCQECLNEYQDPSNRRFHAQPNACSACGPQMSWHTGDGQEVESSNPISQAIAAIINDKIVAIRGLGGFHLSVSGCSHKAVSHLRQRKKRKSKPLAIMVADIEAVRRVSFITPEEEKTLLSPEHPILLLPLKPETNLAANLAPSMTSIGIMLPYTPFHHLLFQQKGCPEALVMTSGNISGSPICTDNTHAFEELGSIADFFLVHNRDIVTRVDDSVGKHMQGKLRNFRRSRGYVPAPLLLPYNIPPVLACGAGLKNTFCLGRDNFAFVSQHIGDLLSVQNYDFFTESVKHLKEVLELEPEAVVCDLHPDYLSSSFAKELGLPLYKIQHHHAHAVAVMAENDLEEKVLAIVLDGAGYGEDGTIWGGEILLSNLTGFKRLGHLEHLPLPGGDAAASNPWRMGFSALFKAYGRDILLDHRLPTLLLEAPKTEREILATMLEKNFNCPPTSSCGRLFDAMSALLGLQFTSDFEGQAAMKLENLASKSLTTSWKDELLSNYHTSNTHALRNKEGKWEIITSQFVKMTMDALPQIHSKSNLALQFHFELINSICSLMDHLAMTTGIRKVVLSGGCMQNQILLEGFYHVLEKSGFKVYTGSNIPVNDGGISLGQAIIGGLQHVSCNPNAGN